MAVTRRQLLASSAAAIAAGWLELPGEPAYAAMPPATGLQAKPNLTSLNFYNNAFTTSQSIEFPMIIRVSGKSSRRVRSVLNFEYDSRLFAPSRSVLFLQRDSAWLADVANTALSPTRSRVQVELDRTFAIEGKQRPVFAAVPLTAAPMYPNENLAAAGPLSFSLIDRVTGKVVQSLRWLPTIAQSGVAPWGVEVVGSWADLEVSEKGKKKSYRIPSLITCTSVGPASFPADSTLQISLDGRLVTNCSISSVELDNVPLATSEYVVTSSRDGDLLKTVVSFARPIPPLSVLRMTPSITGSPDRSIVHGLFYANASFEAPQSATRPQRLTGKYMAADLTSSGSPQVVGTAEGSS